MTAGSVDPNFPMPQTIQSQGAVNSDYNFKAVDSASSPQTQSSVQAHPFNSNPTSLNGNIFQVPIANSALTYQQPSVE